MLINKNYYLGLDLGISSVGWAVMTEENDQYYIDDFGVRLFESSEKQNDGTTNAEQRRIFRSAKRLNRRRKQRINDLKNFLEKINIINKQEIINFFKNYKITNNIQYDNNKYFNPYTIRAKGLTQKLSKEELAVVLINIANHRGYNDKFSFKTEEKENKKSKLNSSINKAENLVKEHCTIAQAILNNENFRNKNNSNTLGLIRNKLNKENKNEENYRYLFSREDYKNELKLILNNQAKFYPQLKGNIVFLIDDIILRQRDFEDGPGPKNPEVRQKWSLKMKKHQFYQSFFKNEGKCCFYRQEPRGYRCSLTFELFQMISALSTFTVKYLESHEIKTIANIIVNNIKQGKIPDKNKIKTIITENSNLNKEIFKENSIWENKEMKISFGYLKFLLPLFPEQFNNIDLDNLSSHFFNKLGKILHENITPKKRKDKLIIFLEKNNINLKDQQIENFLQLPSIISTSTSNTSFKYMEEAISAFIKKGQSYGTFQADFNKKHEDKIFQFNLIKNKLFQPINDEDMIKNAVVYRAINQTRKIINALHKEYNCFFKVINVEVARELAKSFEQRKEIKKNNELNYQKKIEIEEILKNHNIRPNDINIKKYQLWKEQDKKCIYCQDHHEITIKEIGISETLELDHIIPQSIIADNSISNLVLVCAKTNQQKSNRTPLQWMKENLEQKKSFISFCQKIKNKITEKKYEYLMIENIDDETLNNFQSRNLNDTRYITRYVVNWLKSEFKNWTLKTGKIIPTQVQSINGSVTSRFRRWWLKNSPWGLTEKVRDITPYHHAVDAIILTQFTSIPYITFANDIANIINLKRLKTKHIISKEQYLKDCKEILVKWQLRKVFVPNATKKLEQIIYDEKKDFKIFSPLIKNLQSFIENHIPIILKTETTEKEIYFENNKNIESQIPDQKVIRKVKIPKFDTVLNQEEYQEKLKKINSDFHYPFLSYKVNYKLSGSLTSSQMPANSKFEWIKNKTTGLKEKKKIDLYEQNKLKEKYFQDKKGTIWEIDKYYGVAIKIENKKLKPEWIRRINAKPELLNSYKNYQILVPRNIVEYYDKKQNKKVIKLFNGKNGKAVYANLLGTEKNITDDKKSLETFGFQNYRDSIGNWSKDFKILQPNILGKLVKKE